MRERLSGRGRSGERERDRRERERARARASERASEPARERERETSQALRERQRARARERGGAREIASVRERGDGVRDCVTDFDFVVSRFLPCLPIPPPPHTHKHTNTQTTHTNYANHLAIEDRNLGTILNEDSVACRKKKKENKISARCFTNSLPRTQHPSLASTYMRAF